MALTMDSHSLTADSGRVARDSAGLTADAGWLTADSKALTVDPTRLTAGAKGVAVTGAPKVEARDSTPLTGTSRRVAAGIRRLAASTRGLEKPVPWNDDGWKPSLLGGGKPSLLGLGSVATPWGQAISCRRFFFGLPALTYSTSAAMTLYSGHMVSPSQPWPVTLFTMASGKWKVV